MPEKPLHIDIPVRPRKVKEVYSIGVLTFEGDLPAFNLSYATHRERHYRLGAKAQVIAVFHTNAGHVTLNDDSYNARVHLGK